MAAALYAVGAVAVITVVFWMHSSAGRAAMPAPSATMPAESSRRAPNSGAPAARDEEKDGEDKHLVRHLAAIARHEATPVDTAWAKATAEVLRTGLATIAKTSTFRIVGVDCRSESCIAAFEWDDYDAATREWQSVINYSYGVPCGTSIYLPEPKDRRQVYRGKAVYTCPRE